MNEPPMRFHMETRRLDAHRSLSRCQAAGSRWILDRTVPGFLA